MLIPAALSAASSDGFKMQVKEIGHADGTVGVERASPFRQPIWCGRRMIMFTKRRTSFSSTSLGGWLKLVKGHFIAGTKRLPRDGGAASVDSVADDVAR